MGLVERRLRSRGRFRDEERLIVFTEYKTSLDYLARRLRERYAEDRVLTLFGGGGPDGMDETSRENVKAAFQRPGVAGARSGRHRRRVRMGSTCIARRAPCCTTTVPGTLRGWSSATAGSTATARPAT